MDDIIKFIADNIWIIIALLPGATIIAWSIAVRDTKVRLPKALIASFMNANEDQSYHLKD